MTSRPSLALAFLAAFGLTVPAACQCTSRAGPGLSGTSTSGASTASTSSETTASSATATTAPPPDVPAGCNPDIYGECDPWCQDCPEGQKCIAWGKDGEFTFNATRCSPVAPDAKAPGEPCTAPGGFFGGIDDCEKGAMCWNVDPDTLDGTCMAQCDGTPEQPTCDTLTEFCLVANDGVLQICTLWCSPLQPSSCLPGENCLLVGPDLLTAAATPPPYNPQAVDFTCILKADGPAPQATPCEVAVVCNPGLACVDATLVPNCDPNAAPGCCARWCDLSAPDCPEGGTCQPVLQPHPDLPQEFADLGLCLLP